MANLNNKVQEFRRQFSITKSFKDDQVFKLDPKGNLIAVWNNEDYYLTNKRNPTRFLSVSTMQHKLKYGVNSLIGALKKISASKNFGEKYSSK